jgi:glycine/D-amino acid oxidase-like deaminating enzyme
MKAVIVGGGISGLLSAHILATYCDSIVMVDKDELLTAPRVGWNPLSDVSINI